MGSRRGSRRRPLAAAAGALSVLAAAAIVLLLVTGSPKPTGRTADQAGGRAQRAAQVAALKGPAEAPFELRYPAGWTRMADRDLPPLDGPAPTAVLRRSDGRGLVTLQVRGRLEEPLDRVADGYHRALAQAFPDFRLVSSKPLRIPAGTALYTSWVREASGEVQGNLLVQVGDHTYTLDATIPAGATDVAREVGAIFAAFDVGHGA